MNTTQMIYAITLLAVCVSSTVLIVVMVVMTVKEMCVFENMKEWVIYNQDFKEHLAEKYANSNVEAKASLLKNDELKYNNELDNA